MLQGACCYKSPTYSDLCDLTVPTSAIGMTNFDDGFVGLAGTVSSLIGVYTMEEDCVMSRAGKGKFKEIKVECRLYVSRGFGYHHGVL
jgi:hypothetical protein